MNLKKFKYGLIILTFSDGTNFGKAQLKIPQDTSLGSCVLDEILSKEVMSIASDLLAPSTLCVGMNFELIGSHNNAVLFRISFGNSRQHSKEIVDELSNLGSYLVSVHYPAYLKRKSVSALG